MARFAWQRGPRGGVCEKLPETSPVSDKHTPAAHGGPPCWSVEQPVFEGLHSMEGTHTAAAHEELQSLGRTHSGKVQGGLSPPGGTSHWSKSVKTLPPEEERVAEVTCNELTVTAISHPPEPL